MSTNETSTPVEETTPVKKANQLHWKSMTSFTLTCLFTVMLFSGVMLYVSPRGRTAHWTNWKLFGLGKEEWGALHINISIVFVILIVVHLVLNWKLFYSYLRKKTVTGLNRKNELAMAIVVTVLIAVGSIQYWPPFGFIMDVSESMKDYWEQGSDRAPVAHAEELPIRDFALQFGLEPSDVIDALTEEGYEITGPDMRVGDAAATKDVPPSQLLDDLKKHFPEIQTGGGPGGHGGGMGQGQGGMEGGTGAGMGQGQGGMGGGMGLGQGQGQGGQGGGTGRGQGGVGRGQSGMGGGMGMGQGQGGYEGEHMAETEE